MKSFDLMKFIHDRTDPQTLEVKLRPGEEIRLHPGLNLLSDSPKMLISGVHRRGYAGDRVWGHLTAAGNCGGCNKAATSGWWSEHAQVRSGNQINLQSTDRWFRCDSCVTIVNEAP